MRKYNEVLAEKKAAEEAEKNRIENMTDEDKVHELKVLISNMRKYMSIGSFQQKTPKKVTDEFKSLMSQANAIHVERLIHESKE
tara:strand:- start:3822 stop:4073 length:252 start_codon:yes stop_codon:yes gene_type:complete